MVKSMDKLTCYSGSISDEVFCSNFNLNLREKNWLKSIIFISSSSMSEWSSGKEFSVSYLLFGFNCGAEEVFCNNFSLN